MPLFHCHNLKFWLQYQQKLLEKILLLHEEFSKPEDRIRSGRMSRHLFDLYQLYHTGYGRNALDDDELLRRLLF
jgi:hypothetical protein